MKSDFVLIGATKMRLLSFVSVSLMFGFLVGHGTDTPADLFVMLSAIVFIYSVIGVMQLYQGVTRGREAPTSGVPASQRR